MNSKRRNFRLTFAVSAVLLTAIAFFLISVLDNLRGARLDLTSDRLFTMSPAAASILEGLQVPVQVKLYITPTEKMPTQLRTLERDITEQMRNFEQVSQGMLEFAVFNPQDDQEMQQALAAKGIQPFQVQSVDKDEIGVKLIWSALTIAYKDKPEEVIPRILPQSLAALEQDIIGPVYRLTRERTPRVAIFGPKKEIDRQVAMMYLQQGMQPPEPQPQFARIADLLGQGHYEAVPIDLTAASPVPEDVDLLIVMANTQLDDRQVYEINRALRGGLPVVMALQAHEYGYSPAPQGGWTISGQAIDTGLEPMLAKLGLTVSEDHFFDTSMEVIELPREVNLGGLRMQTREPVRAPIQVRVTESQMYQESPLVNRIGSLFFIWGTPVLSDPEQLAASDLQVTNLIESSPDCWQSPWSEGPLPGSTFDPSGKQLLGPRPLAVLVEGVFPDTFADQPLPMWPTPPAAEGQEQTVNLGDMPQPVDPQPGRLFLVGCSKMFDDNIIAASQNALLLLNAVDYLAGSQELLTIRAKTLTQRVIRPVPAAEKVVWRIFVVLLVPVLLAVVGIVRAGVRRKDAARYRQDLRRHGAEQGGLR